MSVPIENWGPNHWGIVAYIESVCRYGEDGYGYPNLRRIQTNPDRHPELQPRGHHSLVSGSQEPIVLADGATLQSSEYDEWDCLADAEREGLIKNVGVPFNPCYRMTELGNKLVRQLRKHRRNGGRTNDFRYRPERAAQVATR